ncbi:MAG TPA: glycosyltransferase [Acidimicrobiia bacterium]|nr:glycosyltransferase [Acidimicrobiia bacterium]
MNSESGDGRIPIVYVTARYPPMASSGTYRVEAVQRFLPDHGFEVTVVTIPPSWVRQQSGVTSLQVGSGPPVVQPTAPSDRFLQTAAAIPGLRWVLREALIPDLLTPWARYVGRRLELGVVAPSMVYATGPPFGALVAAQGMADRLGIPLILEVRDPPSFNRRLRTRSRFTRWRMLQFERKYLGKADAVITVTRGTRRRLLELHPPLDPGRIFVVTNGYPETDVDPRLSGRDWSKFTVAYVGSFQGGEAKGSTFTPEILIPALRQLPADQTRLRIVGPITASQRARLGDAGNDLIEVVGPVLRTQALAEMAAADMVLVLAEDDPWWIGRKVFEAMAYSSRILAVVPPGDAADLLAQSEQAHLVHLDELHRLPEVVSATFREWQDGIKPLPPRVRGLQTDKSCVAQIAEVLNFALGDSGVDR